MKDLDENSASQRPIPLKRTNSKALRFQNGFESEKGNEIWLLTLSDLLMLLMIFFVVLFGMTLQQKKTDQPSLAAPATAQAEPRENRNKTDLSSLENELTAMLNRDLMVERIGDLVILTFPERIVFDPGQARLKPSVQETLNKVASFILERSYLLVEVQGHTDDRPINNLRYPSNWELSVDRATQVAKALMDRGVDPARLSVKGFGEYRPLLPNDSDENRLKNRRVEIQFSLSPS